MSRAAAGFVLPFRARLAPGLPPMSLRPTHIRISDGTLHAYREDVIARVIYLASRDAEQPDKDLAADLAEVVTFFIGKQLGETHPTVDQILDMIERVLMETAPPDVAGSFIRRRGSLQSELEGTPAGAVTRPKSASRGAGNRGSFGQKALFPEADLFVEADSAQQRGYWDRARLEDALTRECQLDAVTAARIAERVEKRVFAAGVSTVTTGLVREVINVELFEAGLSTTRDRNALVGLPRPDLEEACLRGRAGHGGGALSGPGELDAFVSGQVLSRYALSDCYDREVGRAHLDGRLHLLDLDQPARVHAMASDVEAAKTGDAFTPPPDTIDELFVALRRRLDAQADVCAGTIVWPWVSLSLAPYVDRLSPTERRDALDRGLQLLLSSPASSRLRLPIDLVVPPALADAHVIGPRGLVSGRALVDHAGSVLAVAIDLIEAGARLAVRPSIVRASPHAAAPSAALGVIVTEGVLRSPEAYRGLERACDLAAHTEASAPVFLFPRREDPLGVVAQRGSFSRALARAGALGTLPAFAPCVVGSVAINLVQAAYRAGRGNIDGFHQELDTLVGLSRRAIVSRHQFVLGTHQRLLAHGQHDGARLFDLDNAAGTIELVGLSDAIDFLFGDPADPQRTVPNADEAFRAARTILPYLTFALGDGNADGLPLLLDACQDAGVAQRFAGIDARVYPAHAQGLWTHQQQRAHENGSNSHRDIGMHDPDWSRDFSYTSGVRLRALRAFDDRERIANEARVFGALASPGMITLRDARMPVGQLLEIVRFAVMQTEATGLCLPARAADCPSCGLRVSPPTHGTECARCHATPTRLGWLADGFFTGDAPATAPGRTVTVAGAPQPAAPGGARYRVIVR